MDTDGFDGWVGILSCPGCSADLSSQEGSLHCLSCGREYPVSAGIPLLFQEDETGLGADEVTRRVMAFYDRNPFPGYGSYATLPCFLEEAAENPFVRMLDEQIPPQSAVLEAGCGTGQLTNLLGVSHRLAVGADMSVNSLRMAHDFKEKYGIRNARFVQYNLFRPPFKPDSFDYVICSGVLHHTPDPRAGFLAAARLLKPGGSIIVGLYNSYGRLMSRVRGMLFRLSGERSDFLDPVLRRGRVIGDRRNTWRLDQYKSPHESTHTFGEVYRWFSQGGIEYVRTLPGPNWSSGFGSDIRLFAPEPPSPLREKRLAQLAMVYTEGGGGGLFIMVGRKKT